MTKNQVISNAVDSLKANAADTAREELGANCQGQAFELRVDELVLEMAGYYADEVGVTETEVLAACGMTKGAN